MSRPTRATIDLSAFRYNLQHARKLASASKLLAVVKANGYGHGILNAAQGLKQADGYAVACLEEARQLREAGYSHTILLLEGVFQHQELAAVNQLSLEIVVHNSRQIEWLENTTLQSPIRVWLKIDSGMHRLGIQANQFDEFYLRLQACVNVDNTIVLMTHLASADDRQNSATEQQLNDFQSIIEGIDAPESIANSAALISLPDTHKTWARPGIMLYGASPFASSRDWHDDLKPVMTLRSQLIAIKNCQSGDKVGYSGSWTCPEDMSVGVVAIGYGDGYPRHANSDTPVLINGVTTRLLGRVSMDMITVDLRTVSDAAVGDEVILWGEGLPVELVAESLGTISYELLCQVTQRVPMDVIESMAST
ncbi:Alanine racemase [hydrothermal vent metagenome]|uniref:alanine racemase n=1 Tax=hydrothermal vent metagenome TaxID=652676 RepID=A0A3B0YYB3_9ZZZZ